MYIPNEDPQNYHLSIKVPINVKVTILIKLWGLVKITAQLSLPSAKNDVKPRAPVKTFVVLYEVLINYKIKILIRVNTKLKCLVMDILSRGPYTRFSCSPIK